MDFLQRLSGERGSNVAVKRMKCSCSCIDAMLMQLYCTQLILLLKFSSSG